ncbi:hypothetical protein STAL104432_05025 [Streptomyces albus]
MSGEQQRPGTPRRLGTLGDTGTLRHQPEGPAHRLAVRAHRPGMELHGRRHPLQPRRPRGPLAGREHTRPPRTVRRTAVPELTPTPEHLRHPTRNGGLGRREPACRRGRVLDGEPVLRNREGTRDVPGRCTAAEGQEASAPRLIVREPVRRPAVRSRQQMEFGRVEAVCARRDGGRARRHCGRQLRQSRDVSMLDGEQGQARAVLTRAGRHHEDRPGALLGRQVPQFRTDEGADGAAVVHIRATVLPRQQEARRAAAGEPEQGPRARHPVGPRPFVSCARGRVPRPVVHGVGQALERPLHGGPLLLREGRQYQRAAVGGDPLHDQVRRKGPAVGGRHPGAPHRHLLPVLARGPAEGGRRPARSRGPRHGLPPRSPLHRIGLPAPGLPAAGRDPGVDAAVAAVELSARGEGHLLLHQEGGEGRGLRAGVVTRFGPRHLGVRGPPAGPRVTLGPVLREGRAAGPREDETVGGGVRAVEDGRVDLTRQAGGPPEDGAGVRREHAQCLVQHLDVQWQDVEELLHGPVQRLPRLGPAEVRHDVLEVGRGVEDRRNRHPPHARLDDLAGHRPHMGPHRPAQRPLTEPASAEPGAEQFEVGPVVQGQPEQVGRAQPAQRPDGLVAVDVQPLGDGVDAPQGQQAVDGSGPPARRVVQHLLAATQQLLQLLPVLLRVGVLAAEGQLLVHRGELLVVEPLVRRDETLLPLRGQQARPTQYVARVEVRVHPHVEARAVPRQGRLLLRVLSDERSRVPQDLRQRLHAAADQPGRHRVTDRGHLLGRGTRLPVRREQPRRRAVDASHDTETAPGHGPGPAHGRPRRHLGTHQPRERPHERVQRTRVGRQRQQITELSGTTGVFGRPAQRVLRGLHRRTGQRLGHRALVLGAVGRIRLRPLAPVVRREPHGLRVVRPP